MAADPNAVPIQPLNVGYSFTPTEYKPQAVNVPSDAGRLWAQVGDTAMKASQMLQNSPLNPTVRAQMQEALDRAKVGSQISQYAMAHPKWRRAIGSEGPGGASLAAPATLPVSQVTNWDLDQDEDDDKDKGKDKGNPPKSPPPAPTQPTQPTQPADKEAKPKSHQEEMGQVSYPGNTQIAQTSNVNPNLAASTNNAFLINRMMQERQAAGLDASSAAPQGTPSNLTFLNPATGNVEPRMFTPPSTAPPQQAAAPMTPSPGMFAGRVTTPPAAAPSAPPQTSQPGNMLLQGAQPSNQTPGSAISQITQQPGVALANWQNQNIHPVVAPKQVLDAVRTNVTTQAQDATYLPNGGVNGEPAWTIHMKGGGQSTISASQLAASPWGKALMAGHNTSEVMEAQNPPETGSQPQPGQPPTPMPSGTGAGAPQGSPAPPAPAGPPTPMPSGTGMGAPQGPPPAPGPQAYNPAPYQQMVATAMAQPGNLMAQEGPQAGVRPTDAGGPASEAPPQRTQAEASRATAAPQTVQVPTPPEQVTELNADADAKTSRRVWQTDPTDVTKGAVRFTRKQSPRAGFYEQRYYRGSPGWEDGLWTPENVKRQEALETYGSANSGIPRSEVLDKGQVEAMSMPEVDALLAKAVWWKTHNLPMNQEDQNRLNAESNASKAYQTLLDMSKWVQENKGNPKDFTNDSILKAFEAANRDGIMTQQEGNELLNDLLLFPQKGQQSPNVPPAMERGWDLAQYAYHDAFAGYQPQHPFSYAVGAKIKNLTKALSLLPEYGERAQGEYDWPQHILGINIPQWHVDFGAPVTTNPSNIPEINSMVTGSTPEAATRNYTEMKRRVDEQYVKDVQNYAYAGKRVPQADIDNMTALSKPGGKIQDDNNPMRDRTTGKLINPYDPGHYATAAASPSPTPSPHPSQAQPLPTPIPRPTSQAEYDNIEPGKDYEWPDGSRHTKPLNPQ
jgi:hypothetical protein